MKSGNLNFLGPSGQLQACNGTALPSYATLGFVNYARKSRCLSVSSLLDKASGAGVVRDFDTRQRNIQSCLFHAIVLRRVREKRRLAPSCLSDCSSASMYQHGSHKTDFNKIWYCGILWKSVGEIQIWLKKKKDRHFAWQLLGFIFPSEINPP